MMIVACQELRAMYAGSTKYVLGFKHICLLSERCTLGRWQCLVVVDYENPRAAYVDVMKCSVSTEHTSLLCQLIKMMQPN